MTLTTTRPDYAAARKAMIDSQLRTSGVNDTFVLERMGTLPREDFVPEGSKATAYMDRAIRLADGGFLPAPLFHGAMLIVQPDAIKAEMRGVLQVRRNEVPQSANAHGISRTQLA